MTLLDSGVTKIKDIVFVYGTILCYEAGFITLALSAVFMSVLGVFHMPVSRVSNMTLFNTRTDMTKSKSYTHHLT